MAKFPAGAPRAEAVLRPSKAALASCLSTLLARKIRRGEPLKPEHIVRANFLKVAIPAEATLPEGWERTDDGRVRTIKGAHIAWATDGDATPSGERPTAPVEHGVDITARPSEDTTTGQAEHEQHPAAEHDAARPPDPITDNTHELGRERPPPLDRSTVNT